MAYLHIPRTSRRGPARKTGHFDLHGLEGCALLVLDQIEALAPGPRAALIALATRSTASVGQVAKAIRASSGHASVVLDRLADAGWVVRVSRGVYSVREGVREVAWSAHNWNSATMLEGHGGIWWDSNECWGIITHPVHWRYVLLLHGAAAKNAKRGPGVGVKNATPSFGFRSEHLGGEPLHRWVRRAECPAWLRKAVRES